MHIAHLSARFCDDASYLNGYTTDTIRRYQSNLKLFCKQTKIENLEEVTPERVRSFFFEGRSHRHWTASTFITYRKTLQVFFRWCMKQHYLSANPIDEIEKPRLEKRIPEKLTREEAERLLELIDNYPWGSSFLRRRNHALFATLVFAGLRKGELLNLKFTDVDLANSTLYVRQGKGRKDRMVPMCRRLADSLERYLAERQRTRKTCPEFFASLTMNTGFTASGFKHLLEVVVQGFGRRFGAHKLRHTFATLMLEGGCDIFSLSQMMGHSDIKTTTIYLTASAQHLRAQIGKHPLNEVA